MGSSFRTNLYFYLLIRPNLLNRWTDYLIYDYSSHLCIVTGKLNPKVLHESHYRLCLMDNIDLPSTNGILLADLRV